MKKGDVRVEIIYHRDEDRIFLSYNVWGDGCVYAGSREAVPDEFAYLTQLSLSVKEDYPTVWERGHLKPLTDRPTEAREERK